MSLSYTREISAVTKLNMKKICHIDNILRKSLKKISKTDRNVILQSFLTSENHKNSSKILVQSKIS